METEGAVLYELGQPLRIVKLTVPPLRPGQVLVEMAFSGVCHSQLLEVQGKRGPDKFLPHTLGHEGAGKVISVGDRVGKVKPGDRVVVSWIKGMGADVPSVTYQAESGPVNSGAISTFMRHAIVSENRVFPIAREMPLKEAALLGCAVPTGAGVIINTAQVKAGMSVAVFGAGGIGMSAILAADMMGASPIIAVDVNEKKLSQAGKAGATDLIDARRDDPLGAVMARTAGKGVDVAVEAAGKRETMEAAFVSVRDGGGMCILVGNLPKGERISIDPFDLIKGKRIVGTWGGESRPDTDIPRMSESFMKGRLKLDRIDLKPYDLDDVNVALDDLDMGLVGRAVLVMAR